RLEDAIDHTLLDPAIIASLGGLIRSEPLRQVAPAPPRTRQPQKRIKKSPAITARTPLALAASRHKLTQHFPLIVPEYLAFHTSLQKPVLNQKTSTQGIPKLSLQPRSGNAASPAIRGSRRCRPYRPAFRYRLRSDRCRAHDSPDRRQ